MSGNKFYEICKQVLKDNPTCEKCHKRPSIGITPYGKIEAACKDCIDYIFFQRAESLRISRKVDEEYDYY